MKLIPHWKFLAFYWRNTFSILRAYIQDRDQHSLSVFLLYFCQPERNVSVVDTAKPLEWVWWIPKHEQYVNKLCFHQRIEKKNGKKWRRTIFSLKLDKFLSVNQWFLSADVYVLKILHIEPHIQTHFMHTSSFMDPSV